jgi:hypothetical protein
MAPKYSFGTFVENEDPLRREKLEKYMSGRIYMFQVRAGNSVIKVN